MNSYTGNRCDPLDPALCDQRDPVFSHHILQYTTWNDTITNISLVTSDEHVSCETSCEL